jgi:hypothetical protein
MDKVKEIWGVVKSTVLNAWDEFSNELGFLLGTIQVSGWLIFSENFIVLLGGIVLVLMTASPVWNKYKS